MKTETAQQKLQNLGRHSIQPELYFVLGANKLDLGCQHAEHNKYTS